MSSKYGEVPDINFSLNTPNIIYFCKPQAKPSLMKMTPIIMITIKNLRGMEDISQVWGGSWQAFFTLHPKYYKFLEISGKIHFNEDDSNHYDHHHEPQDDGGCPPSLGRFLTYLYKPQEKSSSMEMTPTIMISIRNLRRMEDVLPSMGRFLTTIFHLTPLNLRVSFNINSNFRFSEDHLSH